MAFPRDRPWSCAQPKIYIYIRVYVCMCIYIYIVSLVAARLRRRLFGPPSQPGPPLSPAINMLFTLYKSLACSYIALAWLLLADRKLTRRPLSPPPVSTATDHPPNLHVPPPPLSPSSSSLYFSTTHAKSNNHPLPDVFFTRYVR